jgi:hypothetical protein
MYRRHTDKIDFRFQYSLRTLMLIVTAAALVMGLAATFNILELLPVFAAIVFISFLARRLARVDKKGIIFWCASTALMISYFTWHIKKYADKPHLDNPIFLLFAACFFIASVLFLVSENNFKNPNKRNFSCAMLVLATLLLINGISTHFVGIFENKRFHQLLAENGTDLQTYIDDIESVCTKLGRPPNDEQEILKVLEKPLPKIYFMDQEIRISYEGYKRPYYILYARYGNIYFKYDSRRPSKGWIKK